MTSSLPLLEQINQLQSKLESIQKTNEQLKTELIVSQDRFTRSLINASEGLWDWNLETNEIYYSPRWKKMLGYDDHELSNTLDTWIQLIHPDDKEPTLEKLFSYISGQSLSYETEIRMIHKDNYYVLLHSCAIKLIRNSDRSPTNIIGYHLDISKQRHAETFTQSHNQILEMIAKGEPAKKIYNAIGLLYESRHAGLRCSMLELEGDTLLHGGAPSLPKEYCDAVHGLKIGPNIGSCGTSTYTGKRVIVANIETDPKWAAIKHVALPHGMRCCWSEPVKSSSGEVLGAFGMYYDHSAVPNDEESKDLISAAMLTGIVMERDQNQKRIQSLAFVDELTGLSSRAHFYQALEKLIIESKEHDLRFSLLYIDLDSFKNINDSLGHDVGDQHLKQIATRLTALKENVCCHARLGGDEFCLIIKEQGDNSNAESIAKECLKLISMPSSLAGRKCIQTCSIGISTYPDDGSDLKTLLKASDIALYSAKDYGKNHYIFYNEDLLLKAEYRFQVEQLLRDAINNNELSLVYQPQFDFLTGKLIGVEALSRWHHPHLGQVSPFEFISIAERIGMIKPLTESVLKKACTQTVSWIKAGNPHLIVAVNVSPSHFLDDDFIPLIKRVLEETGIAPQNLKLEVTETIDQTQQQNISAFKKLKEIGVLIAIDDFGTGYSSFASLKHLNVDYLKIDKYFIDDLLSDDKTHLLIGSIIDMAHKLGYKVIAEGIEEEEQLNILNELKCNIAQGYLFSEPVSANDISEQLAILSPSSQPQPVLKNK